MNKVNKIQNNKVLVEMTIAMIAMKADSKKALKKNLET